MPQKKLANTQGNGLARTRSIAAVIYPGVVPLDVCGPLDVFRFADIALHKLGKVDHPAYQDYGSDIARFVARTMVMFLRRPGGQSQFSTYLSSEANNRHDIRELQAWISIHPGDDLSRDLSIVGARLLIFHRKSRYPEDGLISI